MVVLWPQPEQVAGHLLVRVRREDLRRDLWVLSRPIVMARLILRARRKQVVYLLLRDPVLRLLGVEWRIGTTI